MSRLTIEYLGTPGVAHPVPWQCSLRSALKCLLRAFGWRNLGVVRIDQAETAAADASTTADAMGAE